VNTNTNQLFDYLRLGVVFLDKTIDIVEFQFDVDGGASPGHRNGVFGRRSEEKQRRLPA
jgi:diadenosine tetraphosphatase ApaH/serine/threonine PP2A family protein phosphatase